MSIKSKEYKVTSYCIYPMYHNMSIHNHLIYLSTYFIVRVAPPLSIDAILTNKKTNINSSTTTTARLMLALTCK